MTVVVAAEVTSAHKVRLWFSDDSAGEVDIAALVPWQGIFAPIEDPHFFRQLRLDRELRTIVWPNGADIDPLVLWSAATGRALAYEQAPV